jgi:hypothetical protein
MTVLAASPSPASSGTTAVARRELRFASLAEILADAESIADKSVTGIGGWTPAQNIDHVRRLIRVSHAGADFTMPWAFRVLGRLIKSRSLRSPLKPGMKTVDSFQPPAGLSLDDALAAFREEIRVASRPGAMSHPSPLFGPMTHEQWEQLHCRHAEHHFGYIVPTRQP